MVSEKHPFETTRERAGELTRRIDEINAVMREIRELGVQQGLLSNGPIAQLGNWSLGSFLLRLKSGLDLLHQARTRSKSRKDLFQALFGSPTTQLDNALQQLLSQLEQLKQQARQNPSQAQRTAQQLTQNANHPLQQLNQAAIRIDPGLPYVVHALSKPDPFIEAAELLNEQEKTATSRVRKLAELEQAAKEKVGLLEELLPDAEALAKEIRRLTLELGKDLAPDTDLENMALLDTLNLLGDHLTALRKVLEKRVDLAESAQEELERLRREAAELEEKAKELLDRSEEVLGHAEGVGLAKWFKQAYDEYEGKLASLRARFSWTLVGVIIGTITYVLGLPLMASWLESTLQHWGWDGNIFASLIGKLVLVTPITVAFLYFWRIYHEYATAERLAHRYRHWQALGASLGGFRKLTERSGELSDELAAATFLAVVDNPLKGHPAHNEETGLLQRLLGIRIRRKAAAGEDQIEAGVLPRE